MTWKKGQSGNPGGGPVRKPLTDALRALISREAGDDLKLPPRATVAHEIAIHLATKAREGDKVAMAETWNRIEGTPTQTIAGDPENPLVNAQMLIGNFLASVPENVKAKLREALDKVAEEK